MKDMRENEIMKNHPGTKSGPFEKIRDRPQVIPHVSASVSKQAAVESPEGIINNGLSSEEVNELLAQFGYNELPEEKINPYKKFLTYFWGPIPWMIEIAALLSALVRHWSDFVIILTLLIVNSVVGFWEEYQAGNAIAALKKKLALKARVKRDGKWQTIPARELVPGDIIRVRIGDIVPADVNLLECDPVEVDQSALTGESLPVKRKSEDLLYSGSIIKQGEADAKVNVTGKDTYFGKTAQLAGAAETPSHFQKAVLKIGDYLIVLALLLVALILIVTIYRGDSFITTLQFALVLTVAAIPVAMPTVLSVTMAIGARFLAKKEAIVSRLASVEEMAGIDILCTDKTGTLTQNKLTLGDPFCVEGIDEAQLILNAALASRSEDQDPIDLAVLSGLKNDVNLEEQYRVVHFIPFDPVKKRIEAKIEGPEGDFMVTKGAPQVVLDLCINPPQVKDRANQFIEDFAHRGYRSLGVARKDTNQDWQFLGVLTLYDPPRPDSKATIETAEDMGLKVKMVTGDQVVIGKEIARQIGLGDNILDAGLFAESKPHESGQLAEAIERADGFAQVFPEHKYHIVDTLQKGGHIVGMTGDGVNDAPALKKADAGIAVSGATDAARSAADIVLISPGLSVIIDAVKESRKIFKRMDSYAIYRIAETIRVLLFMTASILVFNFYPVTPVMIVLLALLNDGAIISIAYDNVRVSNKPERWNMHVVLGIATLLGILGVFASFGIFYIGDQYLHLDRATLQTLMYLKLSVAGHLTIFLTRTRRHFWSSPAPSRILVLAVLGTQTVATLLAVYGIFMAPLGWSLALLVWGYALIWFIVNDFFKVQAFHVFDHELPGLLAMWR